MKLLIFRIELFYYFFRGKLVLGYSDNEFTSMSGYELVHPDDLKYYANSHKECMYIFNF